MTGPQGFPGAVTPPIDDDDSDDDVLENVDGLPDDVPNDALTSPEMLVDSGPVPDTNVDDPVLGTPPTDDEIGG